MNLAKKITLFFLTTLVLTVLHLPTVFAQENTNENGITPNELSNIKSEGFTIIPANPNTINPRKFIFEIKPEETSEDYVQIHNLSDQPMKFLLYGADPTVSAQGTPAYKTRQTSGSGEGSWIKFDNPEIILQANEQLTAHFTITIPKDTELGDYRAGITMEKSKADANNPNITIATRVILHSDIKVTNDPQPIPKQDGSFAASLAQEDASWQIIYFWISLGLFTISFFALILVTYQERKRKILLTDTKPATKKKRPTQRTSRRKKQ